MAPELLRRTAVLLPLDPDILAEPSDGTGPLALGERRVLRPHPELRGGHVRCGPVGLHRELEARVFARAEEQDKGGDAARAALALVAIKRRLGKR